MMLETYKQLIVNQFEAAFCTLDLCLRRCPEATWGRPVAKSPFCQVMFHTLFFADYYLSLSEDAFRHQSFHSDHRPWFGDYEQLQDREATSLFEKPVLDVYLGHTRQKAKLAVAAETSDSLAARTGFPSRNCSRAELYVYNLRHVYHHAAQLVLRLRLDTDIDIPWVDSGWRDTF